MLDKLEASKIITSKIINYIVRAWGYEQKNISLHRSQALLCFLIIQFYDLLQLMKKDACLGIFQLFK